MTHQENFFRNNNPRQSQFLKKLLEAIRKSPQANSSDVSIDIMYIDQKTLHQYCSQQKDQQHPLLLQTIAIQIMIRLQLLHHFGISQIPSYFLLDWKKSNPSLAKSKKKKKNLVQKNTRKVQKVYVLFKRFVPPLTLMSLTFIFFSSSLYHWSLCLGR
jgi:ERCC4-related helicase